MNQQTDDFLDVPAQQAQFRELVGDALRHAKQVGATDAAVEISESRGLSVSVRQRAIETIEQTRDRSMAVTVFAGQRRGSASTSDFSAEALRRTVDAAWHIARYTAEDPAAGLPEPERFALHSPDLDLHHPWAIDAEGAARLAIQAERAALATSKEITNSEGASLDTMEGHFVLGNSRGFLGGYPYSRHSLSVAPIAGRGDGMQRDYWYTSARRADGLAAPAEVGRYAAERALSRLGARPVKTGRYPVLFEAPLAVGLLGGAGPGHQRRRAVPQGQLPAGYAGQARAGRSPGRDRKPLYPAAPRAVRPSTPKGSARRPARWWTRACSRAISCPPTRPASWAWRPPAMRAGRTISACARA